MSDSSSDNINSLDDSTLPPEHPTAPRFEDDETLAPVSSVSRQSDSNPLTPTLNDYEIIGELGRGGMGVVYKARQTKLDRTVALKMILGGQFASEAEVQRFQLEAESAARLDHPGIVPVYEVGESQGNHFFSMKLIDGGTLADDATKFRENHRAAAKLMIDICSAVHHAHQRGVLHRDLKPGNVLIDADDNPLLTDLGLAKRLDDDTDLTRTGLVMGSPGFMAPEQAAGRKDITTASDIYSLGALLFWLVTGRAPFVGETQLDVILQTIEKEPSSIREFNSEADGDLNLICQKALQKDPKDRYTSADDLATDLQAWLEGEPLSVRPPSSLQLANSWIRKNFRTVALAIGSGVTCGLIVGFCLLLMIMYSIIGEDSYFQQAGATEHWLVSAFRWAGDLPIALVMMLPPITVYLGVGFGWINLKLIKPKTKEACLVIATTAGLIAGIVAFAISYGWQPVVTSAIEVNSGEMMLLSDSLWIESESERELARQVMLKRYPGLTDVDMDDRGELIHASLHRNQSLGVPTGLWKGMAATLLLVILPLAFNTATAGWMQDRPDLKGWSLFWNYFERSIYGTLLFIATAQLLGMLYGWPGWLAGIITLVGTVIAFCFSLIDARWYWRLFGFALVMFCTFYNGDQTARIANASSLIGRANSDEEERRNVAYLQRAVDKDGRQLDQMRLAIAYAYFNEDEKYRRACRRFLDDFSGVFHPSAAEQRAKACLLKAELLSAEDAEFAHRLAETASEYEASEYAGWNFFCRALSELRQGNRKEARDWTNRCRSSIEVESEDHFRDLILASHCIDAISFVQDGNETLAKESLLVVDQQLAKNKFANRKWYNRFTFELLQREATAALKSPN